MLRWRELHPFERAGIVGLVAWPCILLAGIALHLGLGIPGSLAGMLCTLTGFGFVISGGTAALGTHRRERCAALSLAADALVCPGCRYDLSALSESGACPECGRVYSHAELRTYWRKQHGGR